MKNQNRLGSGDRKIRTSSGPFFAMRLTGGTKSSQGFIVHSTGPLQLDVPMENGNPEQLDAEQTVDEIMEALRQMSLPHVIVHVHGFNNPPTRAERRFQQGWDELRSTPHDSNVLYLGFCWPSSGMRPDLRSLLADAPKLIKGLLTAAAISFITTEFLSSSAVLPLRLLTTGLLTVALTLLLLRGTTYYQDRYRAAHFGVMDLMELLRRIDDRASRDPALKSRCRVKLSLVGHSMGAFVVTELIRILSDVFSPDSITSATNPHPKPSAKIGHRFELNNLVLVSADIPAEALVDGSANFLASSLRRFPHCYLVTNEADIVLSLISTAANSIEMPVRRQRRAVRLGNLALERGQYGLVTAKPGAQPFAAQLWTGFEPFSRWETTTNLTPLVTKFTVVDCTDAIENKRPILSLGTQRRIGSFQQVVLAGLYLLGRRDVHSAYFDHACTLRLVFGLASDGLTGLESRFESPLAFNMDLISHRIAIMPAVSPSES